MRHIIFAFLSLFSVPLVAVVDNVKTSEFVSQQTLDLSSNNSDFAFNLYRNIEGTEGNICFSPYSISSALAMVYDGARDETRKEMGDVLNFTGLKETINEGFSLLNRFFEKTSTDIPADFRLYISNSLWLQTGTQILPQYLDQMAKYFKTGVHRVDFARQKETARREINYFVKEKTMGKIIDLIGPSDIPENTKMILVSSIYMRAKWQNLFDEANTKMLPFFVSSNKTVSTPTMNETGYYPYYKAENYSAVALPYIHPKENLPELEFLILLPHDNNGLNDIKKTLNAESFKNILSNFESEELHIYLPKFEFTKSFSLKSALIKMGMVQAFNSDANFEGINGSKDLQIGQVSHKAFISVDESGTEAAAATAVIMTMKAILNPKEPITFRVDHPFMFVIYEKLTGSILFCGHVMNPLE